MRLHELEQELARPVVGQVLELVRRVLPALRLADVSGPVLADLEPAALMTLTGEDVHAAAKALGEDGPGQRRRRFLTRE